MCCDAEDKCWLAVRRMVPIVFEGQVNSGEHVVENALSEFIECADVCGACEVSIKDELEGSQVWILNVDLGMDVGQQDDCGSR